MKEKGLLTIFAGLFLAVFILGFSSAALTVSDVPTLEQNEDHFLFTLESNMNDTVDINVAPIIDGTQTIEFEAITGLEIENGTQELVRVNYSAEDFNFDFKEEYNTTMTLTGNETITEKVSFESNNYCGKILNEGNLDVRIEDVEVVEGFGDEDDFWYLFDEIEIEVEVRNNGDYDLEDVELEWMLYAGNKKILNDDVSRRDIDENDEEVYFVNFKLDEDIDDFEDEEAYLYIRAIGEIDDRDSEFDGDLSCDFTEEEYEVVTNDRFVILNEFNLNGFDLDEMVYDETIFSCEDVVSIGADVWNIGDRDEDEVYVQFYNNKLGINEKIELGDIDAFDDDSVFFEFEIPEDVEDEWQSILIQVYDDDNDLYENSEDDKSEYAISIKTESCYVEPPTISAVLESEEAIAGENIVIVSSITNIDDKALSGSLLVEGYSEWANLESIDTSVIDLESGETVQVRMEFSTKKDAEGEQSFEMEVLSEGEVLTNQPVSVSLEKGKFNLWDFIVENQKILGIVLLNLILLIFIIVIAVKILRKK